MASAKLPRFDVDQTLCGLRWLPVLLTPALAYLGHVAGQTVDLTLILGLTAAGLLYNSVAYLLLYLKFFPTAAAWVFLILDALLSIGFLLATDFHLYPLLTIGLFTTLEAAFRFDLTVGIGSAVVVAFSSGLGTILVAETVSLETFLPSIIGLAGLSLAAGSAGTLSVHIGNEMARARDEEMRRLKRDNERAKAIHQMTSALSTTLDYQRALESTLDISLMGLEKLGTTEQQPVGILFLYGGEGMYVATARHLKSKDRERTIIGEGSIIAKVLSDGESTVVNNLYRDQELAQFESLSGSRSAILVPLMVGFDVYGVLLVASPVPNAFTDEHKELVAGVCSQAVMALQNAQLYQDLRQERDGIIDQHEEARAQLARDLHDGPTQSISAIAMRLNYVKALLHRDPVRIKKELDDLEALARRTTREIRTMLFTLRPQILETQGLTAAVKQYAGKIREDADFEIHLELMDLSDALDINTQAVAFNIIEESMNNIKKHAQCQNVWIRLGLQNNVFIAQIKDDGKGFDVQATLNSYDQRGSLGLLNLYERAQLVEGKTEIVSAPGQGTTVTLIVPLKK